MLSVDFAVYVGVWVAVVFGLIGNGTWWAYCPRRAGCALFTTRPRVLRPRCEATVRLPRTAMGETTPWRGGLG